MLRKEFVYLLKMEFPKIFTDKKLFNAYIKVGRSNNPDTRCQNLKAGNPFRLFFLKTLEVSEPLKVADAENFIQKELAQKYSNNLGGGKEWFEVEANNAKEKEDEILQFIKEFDAAYEKFKIYDGVKN